MSCNSLSISTRLFFGVVTIILTGLAIATPHSHIFSNELDVAASNDQRAASGPAPLNHVLETSLYVKNMNASVKFYQEVLGLTNFLKTNRLSGFNLGTTTLLLFHLGETSEDLNYQGTKGSPGRGQIAGHGPDRSITSVLGVLNNTIPGQEPVDHAEGSLKLHYAFAVEKRDDVLQWEEHLKEKKVHIHSTMEWDRGGRSVYFFDPDGHVGEIVSRGIWPHW